MVNRLFCFCGEPVGWTALTEKNPLVFCSCKCLALWLQDNPMSAVVFGKEEFGSHPGLVREEVSSERTDAPTFACFQDVPTDLDVQPTLTVTPHGTTN